MSICPKTVIKVAKKEIGYIEKSKSAYKMDPSVLDKKKRGCGVGQLYKIWKRYAQNIPVCYGFSCILV